jgi:hypothetical protein
MENLKGGLENVTRNRFRKIPFNCVLDDKYESNLK